MSGVLEGTVALVTGASSGIGEATATALAEDGAVVVLAARRRDRLEQLAERIGGGTEKVLVLEVDVTDETQVNRMVADTVGRFGRLDTLVTQNIDGLHDRAGSRNVLKLHGDIWTVRCTGCGRESHDDRAPLPDLPPRCECGALLRPAVVWFGEFLPPGVWSKAEHASARADVFLIVGTSAVVHPAAGLIDVARMAGATTVEINPQATPYSDAVDYALRGPAGEILPTLL